MFFVVLGSVILFSNNSNLGDNGIEGLTLAMGSAFGFAIYLILAKSMVPKLGLWRYFGLVNLFAALTILPWLFVRNQQSSDRVFVNTHFYYSISPKLVAACPGCLLKITARGNHHQPGVRVVCKPVFIYSWLLSLTGF